VNSDFFKLEARRIELRRLSVEDISNEYLQTLNSVEYMKYSRHSMQFHTFKSQEKYITDFLKTRNIILGIFHSQTKSLIGTLNCYINFDLMELNLGFLVFEKHSKQGFVSEALEAFIHYLEDQFPNMTMVIGTHINNVGMQKVAERLGFIQTHEKSENGVDALIYKRKIESKAITCIIPDFILNSHNIGVAVYDSGGAQQVKFLVKNLRNPVLVYAEGPALEIFNGADEKHNLLDSLDSIYQCDLILTGSGWMSTLERNAIERAKGLGIPAITLLDHWVNYQERFDGPVNTPDALLVTNSPAFNIAKAKFPGKVVWQIPDYQLIHYKEILFDNFIEKDCTLVLLEPINQLNEGFEITLELLSILLDAADDVSRRFGSSRILLRLHPSQVSNKEILELLTAQNRNVEISEEIELVEDLRNANCVIGINTYGLYLASECNIKTFSLFSGSSGHWTNHFSKIRRVL
jgi:RimJ/RimL family protein N-acetyltransferase